MLHVHAHLWLLCSYHITCPSIGCIFVRAAGPTCRGQGTSTSLCAGDRQVSSRECAGRDTIKVLECLVHICWLAAAQPCVSTKCVPGVHLQASIVSLGRSISSCA